MKSLGLLFLLLSLVACEEPGVSFEESSVDSNGFASWLDLSAFLAEADMEVAHEVEQLNHVAKAVLGTFLDRMPRNQGCADLGEPFSGGCVITDGRPPFMLLAAGHKRGRGVVMVLHGGRVSGVRLLVYEEASSGDARFFATSYCNSPVDRTELRRLLQMAEVETRRAKTAEELLQLAQQHLALAEHLDRPAATLSSR